MSHGTVSMHAGAVRRACRAQRATHPIRIIRRARRGASSAKTAWMTNDDRRAIPGDPRAAGDGGHLVGLDHRHPAGACVGIPVNRVSPADPEVRAPTKNHDAVHQNVIRLHHDEVVAAFPATLISASSPASPGGAFAVEASGTEATINRCNIK